MDSVSQVVLGGAVSYAVLGNQLGRKALVIGAVLGTVPDLDVLIDFGGAVENFVYHRSFSHSLLMQALVTPLIVWCMLRFKWAQGVSWPRWCVAVFGALSTHALLDTCTVYGTQILWPLTDYPFATSNLFIIDPAYTLPLLLSFLLILANKSKRALRLNNTALIISCVYIGWSFVAKLIVDNKIDIALSQAGIAPNAYVSTPSAFNTLLWRAVVVTDDAHYEIYASVFDTPEQVSLYRYASAKHLLNNLKNERRLQQLQAFSKGIYGVYERDQTVLLSDLRMGIEGAYVFTFEVGKIENGEVIAADFEQQNMRPPLSKVGNLFRRITDPTVDLSMP